MISFTNWAHSSELCDLLSISFCIFAENVLLRFKVLGSAFGVLTRLHSCAFVASGVKTGPGSNRQHLNRRTRAKQLNKALLMIMILENGDFHARSPILLALLSLKTRRQTRGKCLHTMIRTYFTWSRLL